MRNKLTAIICAWDGMEFLPFLIPNLQKQVDDIVIVYSLLSNYGNENRQNLTNYDKVKYVRYEPRLNLPPYKNETEKRNFGLDIAVESGATHILMCDVDEFYETDKFNEEKEKLYSNCANGYVCALECYFRSPTLSIGIERTLVPFIHKVVPGLRFGPYKDYPFAYDDTGARIDPTRRLSVTRRIEWSDIVMHHFSWVRKDINLKINNSTARNNLLKSCVLEDYHRASAGYFCHYYQKELIEKENKFGIRW